MGAGHLCVRVRVGVPNPHPHPTPTASYRDPNPDPNSNSTLTPRALPLGGGGERAEVTRRVARGRRGTRLAPARDRPAATRRRAAHSGEVTLRPRPKPSPRYSITLSPRPNPRPNPNPNPNRIRTRTRTLPRTPSYVAVTSAGYPPRVPNLSAVRPAGWDEEEDGPWDPGYISLDLPVSPYISLYLRARRRRRTALGTQARARGGARG